jgi:hypothetical protein
MRTVLEYEMLLAVNRNAVGALVDLGRCEFLTGPTRK